MVASFVLTGCQSVVKPVTNTADTVSGTGMESSAAPSESTNNDEKADESSSSPSVVAGTSISQTENEIETNQSEQTVDNLKITTEGVPVEVRLASDGQYNYEYDKDEYAVTATTNGSAFEITVTDIKPEIDNGNNVVIYIPNQSYALITGIADGSSLILPAINANITLTSNASSVVVGLPPDYNKTINYTGNASSCSLSMSDINDFTVNARISTSAVMVPNDWPTYDMLSPDYIYTSGNGMAKINIDVTSSSFIFK